MSIFGFLQDIPLSAVLREKLKVIEAQVAELQTENQRLRDANAEKEAQIQALSNRLDPIAQPKLAEPQELILRVLAKHDELGEQEVAQMTHVGAQVATFHLEELRRRKFVHVNHTPGSDWAGQAPRTDWSLAHAGREYLVLNGLIE